jgi:hypothetical protein
MIRQRRLSTQGEKKKCKQQRQGATNDVAQAMVHEYQMVDGPLASRHRQKLQVGHLMPGGERGKKMLAGLIASSLVDAHQGKGGSLAPAMVAPDPTNGK